MSCTCIILDTFPERVITCEECKPRSSDFQCPQHGYEQCPTCNPITYIKVTNGSGASKASNIDVRSKSIFEPGDSLTGAQANGCLDAMGIDAETPDRFEALRLRVHNARVEANEAKAYIASWKRDEANWIGQERDLKQRIAELEEENTQLQAQTTTDNVLYIKVLEDRVRLDAQQLQLCRDLQLTPSDLFDTISKLKKELEEQKVISGKALEDYLSLQTETKRLLTIAAKDVRAQTEAKNTYHLQLRQLEKQLVEDND